jgi:hypothetical protein
MAFFWGMLLAHASWWAWSGSVFWGPRFLLVAGMPASFALALHLSNSECRHAGVTLLTVSALIWSIWVGVEGTVIHQGYADACTAYASRYEALCWYVPEYSELIQPFVRDTALATWDKVYIVLSASVAVVLAAPRVACWAYNYAIARALSSGS